MPKKKQDAKSKFDSFKPWWVLQLVMRELTGRKKTNFLSMKAGLQ